MSRSAVLRHYVLLTLRAEGRPLVGRELLTALGAQGEVIQYREIQAALSHLEQHGEVCRLPLSGAMRAELGTRGVTTTATWAYALGAPQMTPRQLGHAQGLRAEGCSFGEIGRRLGKPVGLVEQSLRGMTSGRTS